MCAPYVCACTCVNSLGPKAWAGRPFRKRAPPPPRETEGGGAAPTGSARRSPREVIRCPGAVIGRGAACHTDVTCALVADWLALRVCLAHVLAAALPGTATDGLCHKDLTDLPSAFLRMPTRARLLLCTRGWRRCLLRHYLRRFIGVTKKEKKKSENASRESKQAT